MRPFSNIITCVHLLWFLAALQRGPPVTTAGVAPYSPWAVLVTWNQPNGVSLNDIWNYRLDFHTFSVEVPATHTLMFYFRDTNIYPGSDLHVSIYAIYRHMNQSLPKDIYCRVVPACTSTFQALRVFIFNWLPVMQSTRLMPNYCVNRN